MVPIGAAFAPMGFNITEATSSASKSSNGVDATPFIVAFLILAVLIAGGVTAYSFIAKNQAQTELDKVNRDIDAIKDIEDIVTAYDEAESIYVDAMSMYSYTRNLNENVGTFITELEDKMPKGVDITAFSSDSTGVSLTASTTEYEDIAAFAINLKEISCIANSFVGSITENADEQSGEITYDFTLTCIYVDQLAVSEEENSDADVTLGE
jgi:type IV pilus assembly protein PilM